jgi:hypothetical protein
MTQIEYFPNSINFNVIGVQRHWDDITQYFGYFNNNPNEYQILEVKTDKGTFFFAKSRSFIPVSTKAVQEIARYIAKELNMLLKNEYTDGIKYWATLVSPQITDEVEPGDLVAFGIRIRLNVAGSLRTDYYTYRLECSNGLTLPVDVKIATIKKSYDVETMKESFVEKAKLLQETFKKELDVLREFKYYTMNKELAEAFAKKLPKPIINSIINVGKNKTVQGFNDKINLWQALNAVTEQTTRKLNNNDIKFATKEQFDSIVLSLIKENIEKQKKQAQTS